MGISKLEKAEIVMNLAGVYVPCSSCSGILDICSLSIMLSLNDLVLSYQLNKMRQSLISVVL